MSWSKRVNEATARDRERKSYVRVDVDQGILVGSWNEGEQRYIMG